MVIDMAVVQTLIGNVKGPQGETGATGATGAKGDAATITVGSVSTTAYGNAARVENVGTENDAILNFTIPQGAPGQRTTTMSGLTLDTVTTSAEEFPVPAVGENGATVWGKVIKWFADGLAAIRSKLDANKVVNSQAVTEAGYALDAQQANPNVNGSLAAQISGLNDSLDNKYKYYNTESRAAFYNAVKANGYQLFAASQSFANTFTDGKVNSAITGYVVYNNMADAVEGMFYQNQTGRMYSFRASASSIDKLNYVDTTTL
jgi:hypothetical protein